MVICQQCKWYYKACGVSLCFETDEHIDEDIYECDDYVYMEDFSDDEEEL